MNGLAKRNDTHPYHRMSVQKGRGVKGPYSMDDGKRNEGALNVRFYLYAFCTNLPTINAQQSTCTQLSGALLCL